MDVIEIINTWKIANNPTPKQEKLAELRGKICGGTDSIPKCEYYTEIIKNKKWSAICGGCGCPIAKKIFTPKFNPCPLKKWAEIDNQYIPEKNTSSLI